MKNNLDLASLSKGKGFGKKKKSKKKKDTNLLDESFEYEEDAESKLTRKKTVTHEEDEDLFKDCHC